MPGVSVRQGDWKLIRRFEERPDRYEGTRELFNLKDDLGETKNLAAQMPDKVKELDALIDAFVKDTGALYPKPNPAYKPRPAAATGGARRRSAGGPCAEVLQGHARRRRAARRGRRPHPVPRHRAGEGRRAAHAELRARSAAGGAGQSAVGHTDQADFPKTGQTAEFKLAAGTEWQDITVVPLSGTPRIVRLYLPADNRPSKSSPSNSCRRRARSRFAWNFGSPKVNTTAKGILLLVAGWSRPCGRPPRDGRQAPHPARPHQTRRPEHLHRAHQTAARLRSGEHRPLRLAHPPSRVAACEIGEPMRSTKDVSGFHASLKYRRMNFAGVMGCGLSPRREFGTPPGQFSDLVLLLHYERDRGFQPRLRSAAATQQTEKSEAVSAPVASD